MRSVADVISSWIFRQLSGAQSLIILGLLKKVFVALLTCIFALGGALIGVISGALKGQTTEIGIIRGTGVGAVAGAITGIQLIDLILNGEPFSKVALICSLVNGKIFMEWVSPAVLKAYQWQISTTDTALNEISDIFEVTTTRGLSLEEIRELPCHEFVVNTETHVPCLGSSCAICLQDLQDGDNVRSLPICLHVFHLQCIDVWLTRQGTCPMCREDV